MNAWISKERKETNKNRKTKKVSEDINEKIAKQRIKTHSKI